jgi:hypothetical protein
MASGNRSVDAVHGLVGGKMRGDGGGWLRHPHASSMTIIGSIAVLLCNQLTAGHFCLLEVCFGCIYRDGQSIIVQADQAIATTFFDKALRSRKAATGPIELINNADFLPSPVRGCRPCFERY